MTKPYQPEIRIQKEEVLSANWYRLEKITFDYRRADGQWETQSREVYDRGNGAAILLYNRQKGTVILTRQFRMPTYRNGNATGMLIEACAGLLDRESPEATILREAEEETGYRLDAVRKVGEAYMSPGSVSEILYFFVAEYEDRMVSGAGGGLTEEQENIEVLELPFAQALEMVRSGEIRDAKTIMLLQYAELNGLLGGGERPGVEPERRRTDEAAAGQGIGPASVGQRPAETGSMPGAAAGPVANPASVGQPLAEPGSTRGAETGPGVDPASGAVFGSPLENRAGTGRPLHILVAGPYRSGTGDDPDRIAANVRLMNEVALRVYDKGHLPVLGEWYALPMIETAGSTGLGDAVFDRYFHPSSVRLLDFIDAVLRVGGPSQGADEMVRVGREKGKAIFTDLEQLPSVTV